jgi:RHS repeat-associated protein
MYGPSGIAVEQINETTEKVQYLHHDQAGSTRLITGSSGTVEGKCTYGAYGIPTCEGTATTPLGYDGQLTSPETGLIYLRAREYDPATAQFLSVDPLNQLTRAPYDYVSDNPVNEQDRAGLEEEAVYCYPGGCISTSGEGGGGRGRGVEEAVEKNWHEFESGAERIGNGVASIWNEVTGGGSGERNPAQDKKLTDQEIEALKKGGEHPHALKPGGSSEDLYRDREGNIYTKPQDGSGPGGETGLNIKDFWVLM